MSDPVAITLHDIAYARSGHKDTVANVAVFAYDQASYLFLEEVLTVRMVKSYFKLLGYKTVDRYTVDNLLTINFVIKGVLSSSSTRMLYLDNQGRALGQALLELPLEAPPSLVKNRHGVPS